MHQQNCTIEAICFIQKRKCHHQHETVGVEDERLRNRRGCKRRQRMIKNSTVGSAGVGILPIQKVQNTEAIAGILSSSLISKFLLPPWLLSRA